LCTPDQYLSIYVGQQARLCHEPYLSALDVWTQGIIKRYSPFFHFFTGNSQLTLLHGEMDDKSARKTQVDAE